MIKIIIADDHAVVRTGLKQIIESDPHLKVTGEASSGFELLEKIQEGNYDVVLLDISMPGKDGLETLKEIKRIKPKLPVLIFTVYPEDQYAVRLLKAGAAGYLNKECEPEELIEAIHRVAMGRKYVSENLAELLAQKLEDTSSVPLHEQLSDREFQVLCLIASGKTIKEIADELQLSSNTVSTYRIRILEKMKMKNNAELTHYAIKNGLV
ncbi:MAG: Two-component transcriptional response regulator, LuxR family [Candidatus Kapaibacterium sp.]|jgi:DNA-binding NarL/FixJ family response regulator|nr:MAG: Two-component transcriptional response regulator, LuxR family [Candidatus Kapabacteria bacterium]ROL57890.1 MAG: DNA-binding response regulator [Bacteroidetes/Chlorobi group bacterium Naka2016]